jgi:ribosomal protein S12 methylthiotransferase accessory factor
MKYQADYSRDYSDDILENIHLCQKIVEQQGMQMLVLDQTRPDIGVPVVKVVVPGLRHFWTRFAPGRLYDVPVKMGWLERPLKEEELNPIAMFL